MTDLDRHSGRESAVWLELVGTPQGWLKRCRAAVSGDAVAIAELEDDGGASARALNAAGTRTAPSNGDPLDTEAVSYDWYVARALRSFALNLTELDSAATAGLAEYLREASLIAVGHDAATAPPRLTAGRSDVEDRFLAVSREVDGLPADLRPVAHLLLAELVGRFPVVTDSITVPVLFAGDTAAASGLGITGAGAFGRLTVERLEGGPAGLHPDPRSMCFMRADETFCAGIRNAWSSAPPGLVGSCLVWSVRLGTDASQPVTEVRGGSLGGAFGVALDSLAKGGRRWRSVLPRSLDPRCAVSASVLDAEGLLTGVVGLDQKVAAARSAGLRLVVAAEDLVAAQRATYGSDVHLLGAGTVTEAARLARGHVNRRFRAIVAMAVAMVVIVAGFSVVIGVGRHQESEAARSAAVAQQQREEQEREATAVISSQRLADRSGELLMTDPRFAGLTALAAYQSSPTPQSIKAMSAALQHNPLHAKVFPIPTDATDVVFGEGTAWVAAGNEVNGYSLDTGQRMGDVVTVEDSDHAGSVKVRLVLSPQGDSLVAIGSTVIATFAVRANGQLRLMMSRPIPGLRGSALSYQNIGFDPIVCFSPDGRRLLVIDPDKNGQIWTIDGTSTSPVRVPEHDDVDSASTDLTRDGWDVLLKMSHDGSNSRVKRWSPDDGRAVEMGGRVDADEIDDEIAVAEVVRPSLVLATTYASELMALRDGDWELTGDHVAGFSASASSNTIATVNENEVSLVNLDSGNDYTVYTGGQHEEFAYVRYVSRNRMAAASQDGTLIVVDPKTPINRVLETQSMDISPNGDLVTATNGETPGLIRRTPANAGTRGEAIKTYAQQGSAGGDTGGNPFSGAVVASDHYAAIGGDERDAAPGGRSSSVILWHVGSTAPLVDDHCGDEVAGTLLITPDERLFAVGSGATVCRWQLPSGTRLPDIRLGAKPHGSAEKESTRELFHDGETMKAITGDDHDLDLHLHSVAGNGTDVVTDVPVPYGSEEINSYAVSPTGTLLAYVADSPDTEVTVISLPTARTLQVFRLAKAEQVAISPDGHTLAILDSDRTLHFFDLDTGLEAGPALFDPRDAIADPTFPLFLTWRSPGTIAVDNNGVATKLVDVSHRPTWKQALCRDSPGLTEVQWREAVSTSESYVNPCA